MTMYESAVSDLAERLAAPVAQLLDSFVYQFGSIRLVTRHMDHSRSRARAQLRLMLLLDEGLRILQTPFEPREQARGQRTGPISSAPAAP